MRTLALTEHNMFERFSPPSFSGTIFPLNLTGEESKMADIVQANEEATAPAADEVQQHPMTECDFLSSWTLSWLDPLFAAAEKEGGIVMPDVWSLPQSQQGDDIDERFSAAWNDERERVEKNGQGERPSILRALLSVFGWRFKYVAVYVILFDICLLTSPFFVSNLLAFVVQAGGHVSRS